MTEKPENKSRTSSKTLVAQQKKRFLAANEIGDNKSTAVSVDPDYYGLNPWNDKVKTELKDKYPSNDHLILELPDNAPFFTVCKSIQKP